MHARRLLLVLFVGSLGLLGFLVASEANDTVPPQAVQRDAAAPQPVPAMDGLRIPYKEYAKRVRSRWM